MVCSQLTHTPLKLSSTPPSLSLYLDAAIVRAKIREETSKGGGPQSYSGGGWAEPEVKGGGDDGDGEGRGGEVVEDVVYVEGRTWCGDRRGGRMMEEE